MAYPMVTMTDQRKGLLYVVVSDLHLAEAMARHFQWEHKLVQNLDNNYPMAHLMEMH